MKAGLTPYQSQYFAWLLSRRIGADSADMLASTLVDAQVDLNPHQVEAALFAFQSPLSRGVILADEVGLGKTIEAGLVIAQRWAERKRRILIVVPANLRKQWHQELQDKFSLQAAILEAKSYNQLRREGSRFEKLLMDLTQAELKGHASFDDTGFTLAQTPPGIQAADAPPGRYELPRRSGDAHLYRTGHPLAQALISQARGRQLSAAKLRFSYEGYGAKVSTLEALRGQSGWLALSVLSVEALGTKEEYLLLAATTDSGETLHEEDLEKLLRLPAEVSAAQVHELHKRGALEAALKQQENQRIREVNQRNLGYFEVEVEKLDAWADDLKSGLENEVKELDRAIKDVRRTAAVSVTLEEKLLHQKRQRELEEKRGQLRRRIFDRQDEIDAQRNGLMRLWKQVCQGKSRPPAYLPFSGKWTERQEQSKEASP